MEQESTTKDDRFGFWLTSPNVAAAEIGRRIGYGIVVLDIEHGTFDLAALERFVPYLRSLGLEVIAKVLGPHREPIQQALDFGANAVAVPHIESAEHASRISSYGKFPPLGSRSFAGGRTTGYGRIDDEWIAAQDSKTKVYPMIEDPGALQEIDQILALETVDGVFIGPTDLSLTRGRGAYGREQADYDDLLLIAQAAKAAGKPWILPAWTQEEKEFALQNNASKILLTMEHGALSAGLSSAFQLASELRG